MCNANNLAAPLSQMDSAEAIAYKATFTASDWQKVLDAFFTQLSGGTK